MSQSAITLAFENYKALEATNGQVLKLNEFVLANVPGLDPSLPVDRNETVPSDEYIVHRQAVSKEGVVNQHTVVYSITMGSDVGDFDFNWLGLINKESGLLAMVVHVPTQRKIATAAGQQGNALTRSFLMEYNGAAEATGITTPAETWQIDFTARLFGIDDVQRLVNRDLYGTGAFFGDSFLVTKSGSVYSVTAGVGYIGGLRAELSKNQIVNVTTLPTKIWADVSYQGTVTSDWQTVISLIPAETMVDYVDPAGFAHYVFAVAAIDSSGAITDLRPKGSVPAQESQDAIKELTDALARHEKSRNHPDASLLEKGMVRLSNAVNSSNENEASTPKATKIAMDNANARLAKERNLADLTNPAQARVNLQLGNSATKNIGTTAGTIAAGDDARIVGSMQKALNGSDIQNKQEFLSNLGLTSVINLANNALQRSGGHLTGDVAFDTDARLMWSRNTDAASIYFKNDADADTDSYMAFETADNNNEYFRWLHRQSGGSILNEWMSLKPDGLRVLGGKVYHERNRQKEQIALDSRDVLPNQLANGAIAAYFRRSTIGNGQYMDFLTLNTYVDPSGGNVNAIAANKSSGQLFHYSVPFGSDSWGRAYVIYSELRKPTPSELGIYSIGESNSRFVSDVKLGAEYSRGYAGGGVVKANPGSVLTGLQELSGDNEIHGYYFKPIQILRNGSWVTIAG